MKKKILFIISNLETGGVSKSMTSMMNVIDRTRYDVSLMIVSPHGALMELLPSDLRIITNPVWEDLVSSTTGFRNLLKKGHFLLAIGHLFRLMLSMLNLKAPAGLLLSRLMPKLDEQFDVIVDFNGQQQLYYMVDKLKAPKKLTFFHSDYKKWPYYHKADKKYFPKVDSIWTISETCAMSLKEVFPEVSEKIKVMENISSKDLISRLSESVDVTSEIDPNIPSIITIGHMSDLKGTHWAIEAARILRDKGIKFRWYFLGKNLASEKYTGMIEEYALQSFIIPLGIRSNPYPYLKAADIVCHPSQFEGKSIALDEAKLLAKPIVVTNFSTVGDQFTHRHNATICEMSPQKIAEAIEELFSNNEICRRYSLNLSNEMKDNSSEIQKLYTIFDA